MQLMITENDNIWTLYAALAATLC